MREIILDGPGKNALGSEMMAFIIDELAAADGEPVLLTGAGDAFSAGLNLKEVAGLDAPGMEGFLSRLEELIATLWAYPGPTVAAVNGHAIAGGCILMLCCDHRVVTSQPRAKLGLNEVALGLCFPPGIMHLVRSRVPRRHVHEVVLGARLVDAESALRLGLADELSDDVLQTARERLATLAAHPSPAYAAAKADLNLAVPDRLAAESAFRLKTLPLWTSPELRERLLHVLRR